MIKAIKTGCTLLGKDSCSKRKGLKRRERNKNNVVAGKEESYLFSNKEAYPTTGRISYLNVHLLEASALVGDLVESSLNVDISLTADTTEEELSAAEVRMLIAAGLEEGVSKLVDASVMLLGAVETNLGRIDIAALLVAALHLAVSLTVLADAVLVAVAGAVAGAASRRGQVRSIGLGGRDDSLSHLVDDILDVHLPLELVIVLISRLAHEDTLGGHERNLKGGDSVGDLDVAAAVGTGGTVEVLGDVQGGHALVTVLAGLAVALDVGLDVVELILEGVARLGVDLSVVDPQEGVDISDVGVDGVIVVVGEAAGADGGSSGHIHVVGEGELVEDRASEASLDVEDELLEELLGGHGVESLLHGVSIEIAGVGEADGALRAVVVKEDKNVIVGGGLERLAAADASHVLTSKNLHEVLAVDKSASEILGNTVVHIRAVGLVDDLSGLGVLNVVSDIILHHNDDVLVRDAHLVDNLISMAHISLVTIVHVGVRTSGKNNPGVLAKLLLRQV